MDKLGDGWIWLPEDPKGWRLDKGTLVVRTSTGGFWMKVNNSGISGEGSGEKRTRVNNTFSDFGIIEWRPFLPVTPPPR